MQRELDSLHLPKMREAPHHAGFFVSQAMRGAWFPSDSGRRQTDALLSWQTPSGGWSKRLDMYAATRAPGTAYGTEGDGWAYVPTIDNGATTEQLTYLTRAFQAGVTGRARAAGVRARRALPRSRAQLPDRVLAAGLSAAGRLPRRGDLQRRRDRERHRRAARRRARAPSPTRAGATAQRAAGAAAQRGIACLLRAQVVEHGALTAWGQQHDPLTLRPIDARSYEHASLPSKESATIVDLLMALPSPDARVVAAVHGAAAWFQRSAITGYAYDVNTGLAAQPGAGPLWARMYELQTGRPLFSNRDGVRRYDWNELTDRRTGYGWYTDQPASTLKRYAKWARTHPLAGGAARVTKDAAAPR